jgi:hypothetical protein
MFQLLCPGFCLSRQAGFASLEGPNLLMINAWNQDEILQTHVEIMAAVQLDSLACILILDTQ